MPGCCTITVCCVGVLLQHVAMQPRMEAARLVNAAIMAKMMIAQRRLTIDFNVSQSST